MTRKKVLIIFLAIGLVATTTTLSVSSSIKENKNTLVFRNMEALSIEESTLEIAKRNCTESTGVCFVYGVEYGGIHMKED